VLYNLFYFNVVIEVQIPTEEDLMNVESVDFPSIFNATSNNMFNEMTPMIQIPASILTNQIRDQGCKNKTHMFNKFICCRKESCSG